MFPPPSTLKALHIDSDLALVDANAEAEITSPNEDVYKLYYDDGSIILSVGPSPASMFKVHRSLLARNSPVFESMFALPQPKDNDLNPTIKGVPVLFLPQDDPEGFEFCLKAIYCDLESFEAEFSSRLKISEEAFMDTICSVLATSHKYEFMAVQTRVVKVFESVAPTDLDGLTSRFSSYDLEKDKTTLVDAAVRIVDIAEQFNLPQFLPAALYQICACCTPDEIYVLPKVSWEIRARILLGHIQLQGTQNVHSSSYTSVRQFMVEAPNRLCNSDRCTGKGMLKLRDATGTSIMIFDDIGFHTAPTNAPNVVTACSLCTREYERRLERRQNEIWAQLPEIFKVKVGVVEK